MSSESDNKEIVSRPLCGSERINQTSAGLTCSQSYGGHGERETPGLIPNPEAKPLSGDGTALETGWESRTPPDNHSERGSELRALTPVRLRSGKAFAAFGDGAVNRRGIQ